MKNIGALRVVSAGKELATSGTRFDSGLGERNVRDSVYYHPTLNPTGRPPPGKPQKYKAASTIRAEEEAEAEDAAEEEEEDDGWGVIGEPRAGSGAEASVSGDLWVHGVGPPPQGPPPPLPPPPGAPPGGTPKGAQASKVYKKNFRPTAKAAVMLIIIIIIIIQS